MALLVIASGPNRLLARRMRGYADAQARHIFRDLIDTPADVSISAREVHVRFHRHAHPSIIIASGILDSSVKVPWWGHHTLRMSAHNRPKIAQVLGEFRRVEIQVSILPSAEVK